MVQKIIFNENIVDQMNLRKSVHFNLFANVV